MLYIALFLFSFSTYSADKCVPNNLKIIQCIDMRDHILKEAITKGPSEDSEVEFVKDEKLALKFIKSFDTSKVGEVEDRCVSELIREECKTSKNKSHIKCDAKVDVLNFFNGLIPALKNNKWSKSTVLAGEKVLNDYLTTTFKSQPDLTQLALAMIIVQKAQQNGFLKKDYINVDAMVTKAEKSLSENLAYRERLSPEFNCSIAQEVYQTESKRADDLMKEWLASQKRK
jgi:hypothetical protein